MPADRPPESTPWPLRHEGRCGRRTRCHRAACRQAFGDYRTVEIVADRVIYFCHRVTAPVDPVVLAMLRTAA